jgi:hypothetical protein
MDIVCALVRSHHLEIMSVPTDCVLITADVPTQNRSQHPSMLQRLARRVPLDHRNHLWVPLSPLVLCPSWKPARGFLNCLRSRAYCFASSMQDSRAPKAPHAIPYLAELRHSKGAPRPGRARTRRDSSRFTRTSSRKMEPVTEARREILFLMAGQVKPLVPFSTRKPRTLLSHLQRAQMTAISLKVGRRSIGSERETSAIGHDPRCVPCRPGYSRIRTAGDPRLASIEDDLSIPSILSRGLHPRRITSMIRLRQSKASHHLSLCHFR